MAGEFLVRFGSVGATLAIGSFEIGGEARNFGFKRTAGGGVEFATDANFAILLSVDGASGSALGWPDWLPIKINTLGAQWEDIVNRPEDLTLILSASVEGLPAAGTLQFSGSIENVP